MLRKTPIAPAGGPDALVGFNSSILASTLPETSISHRIHAEVGRYRMRLAESSEDRIAACRLRFRVFNIELGEGLESSYQTGIDTDQFDDVCEHLIVEDKQEDNPSRRIVGTYRMQTGTTAARCHGYYSEQEFDLSAIRIVAARRAGAGACLDRSGASDARGAHASVARHCAVCYRYGLALSDWLLVADLEGSRGRLGVISPAGSFPRFPRVRDHADRRLRMSHRAAGF